MSWTVSVYILASDEANAIPGDESPKPHNGIPHPPHAGLGPVFDGDVGLPPQDDAGAMQGWGDWNNEAVRDNADHGGFGNREQDAG